jgi:hypothetical chaperone protein
MGSISSDIGIDFGTTNSAIAQRESDTVHLIPFGGAETFRSVLYFPAGRSPVLAGPAAISAYLAEHAEGESSGRLVQSIKSLLASRSFTSTNISGRRYTAQDLVTVLLHAIRKEAGDLLPLTLHHVTAGRPVRFVGAETEEDEELAVTRLKSAFLTAGFGEVTLAFEPVGAAYAYESRLDRDELILIADFGGGTSDFCLMPVGPRSRSKRGPRVILGNEGIPLAGDAFDATIVRHVVSPLLGEGSDYTSLHKLLPVPSSIYRKLERWHHLSFLRSPDTLRTLRSIERAALEPERIAKLIALIENDLGLQLHRAVQQAKFELSRSAGAQFHFHHSALDMEQYIARADFEEWISPELDQIRAAVDRLLESTATTPESIDRVFLTGGTSLVPAVRRVFEHLFGEAKISSGDEFTSVAKGLARVAGQTRK